MGNASSNHLGDAFQASHNVANTAEANATTPRAWLHHVGARNALVHAADQGNLALLKLICDSTEGRTFHGVNDGASKSQAPLMRACTHGSARHTECVAYLLAHGADVYAQTSRGDNALHIAAKNGNAGALHALLGFRPHADGEDGSQLLGDIVVQGDAGPTRFIDLHNGSGVTALHLAALKGSHSAVRELLRSGAAADAVTLSGVHNPQLSRGSTALHIAASRGHAGVVTALLEHQTGIPGMELQRLRNARGLKPSQLARLAGHHSVARLLSEVNISSTPQPHASATASSSAGAAELSRRAARAALPTRQDPGRLPAGSPERGGLSQEALLAALTQRARLLLSLRATTLDQDIRQKELNGENSEEAALVAVSAEVAVALRSKGAGNASADSSSTLLGLLSSLADPSNTAAAQHYFSGTPPASTPQRSSADMAGDDASATSEGSQSRQQAKTAKSFAAGALVQAALNAMAVVSPGKEIPISSGLLAPASPLAAIIAVQAALKKLANQRVGSRLLAVSAGQLPPARGGAAPGAGPGMHRANSGLSMRSTASTAGLLSTSGARGRRRRRQNAVRLGLSSSHGRHGAGSEAPDSANATSHMASRRRRHRRSGSFGAMGYPAALSAHPVPGLAASREASTAADPLTQHDAPESSAPSQSRPGSSADPAELEPIQADASTQADRLQAGAAEQPAQEDTPRDSLGRGEGAHLDSTATELPEEWVTALHSMGSSEVASQPISAPSEDGAVPPDSGSRPASALRARPCESSASGFLDKDLEPLLPSDARCSVTASSFPGAGHHPPAGEEPCSQLRVRSRLFSTSEDAPLGTHPQMLASSPTNPFDTAEILGSDSIPSSPFGDSMADEWLHVHEGLLESGSAHHVWPVEDLLARGSLLEGADLTYTQTEDSESIESRDLLWQSAGVQDDVGPQALHESISIEAIVSHQDLSPQQAPRHPLLDSNEHLQAVRMPSVPLPGTAAAQVAEAFGRRTTFQRPAPGQPERSASLAPAGSQSLPATPRAASHGSAGQSKTHESFTEGPTTKTKTAATTPLEQRPGEDSAMERQTVAPSPGAAAAEVRRAFAKITLSSGSSSTGYSTAKSSRGVAASMGVKTGIAGHAEQPASPVFPTIHTVKPAILQEQALVEAVDSASTLLRRNSQSAADAAEQNKKLTCQTPLDQQDFSDQPQTAGALMAQNTEEADSGIREQQMQEHALLGRAMSLSGAAAADTARAFSRLRSRYSTSVAPGPSPSPPASCHTSPDGKSTSDAAPAGDAEPFSGSTGRVSEPGDGFVVDLWGQQSESPSIGPEQQQAAEEPFLDLFPESPARQAGIPLEDTCKSPSDASNAALAPEQLSNLGKSHSSDELGALHGPSIAVPQSAFCHDTTEGPDASLNTSRMPPGQPGRSETKEQAKLLGSLAEGKGVSPRKRASLGRRLSGLLPGVKGKERMRTASVTKEMCFICMDSALEVSISSCQHSLCRQCAYQLCARGLSTPLCPFCRGTIQRFNAIPKVPAILTPAIGDCQ